MLTHAHTHTITHVTTTHVTHTHTNTHTQSYTHTHRHTHTYQYRNYRLKKKNSHHTSAPNQSILIAGFNWYRTTECAIKRAWAESIVYKFWHKIPNFSGEKVDNITESTLKQVFDYSCITYLSLLLLLVIFKGLWSLSRRWTCVCVLLESQWRQRVLL